MVKFTENLNDYLTLRDYYDEYMIGNTRLHRLEQILRIIGNFNPTETLCIKEKEIIDENMQPSIIYEIEDEAETIFRFYPLNIKNDEKYYERYKNNFTFTMQKRNSNLIYVYMFSPNNTLLNTSFSVTDIIYQLPLGRELILKKPIFLPSEIIIKESNKKYRIGFYNSVLTNTKDYSQTKEETDKYLLEHFEEMIPRAANIDSLNVENILTIINKPKMIAYCCIEKDNKEIVRINFQNGEILSYEIIEPKEKIEVTLDTGIKRKITHEGCKPSIEMISNNYEQIQNEVKGLLKKL